MQESLHSPDWYRVSALKPALRPHLRVGRQLHRNVPWFVIHDPASGRNWRFGAETERVVALMDGRRTVDEIWTCAGQSDGEMPTQGEIVRLLAQLHAADALAVDVAPDVRELLVRQADRRKRERLRRFGNPLAIRTRLLDPDAFLTRSWPWVAPLFGRWGTMLWFAVVAWAAIVAARNWREIGSSVTDLALSPGSLLTALAIYPLIKAVHELAHAYAVKRQGGEVHEFGVIWMLLVPVPYVDASAAAAFSDRRSRLMVSAAGILAELFLAAVAMLVWVAVEPGAVRAIAHTVMLIGGVSTLLFNGNPLLRFDGYYVLAELLGIPNLAQRANAHAGVVLRRRVFGLRDATPVTDSVSEARWLLGYAVTSFVYRLFVLAVIVSLIASWSVSAALLIGTVCVVLQVFVPALRSLARLARDPLERAARGRALRRGIVAAAGIGVLLALPLPLTTSADGIMWLPENGEVRAGTDGVLVQWLASPGATVRRGQPLARLEDAAANAKLAVAEAEYHAAESRYLAARANDVVEAGSMLAALQRATAEYETANDRAEARIVTSPTEGLFVVASPGDLEGAYFRQGETIGYVAARGRGTVLAVVDQDTIALIKERTRDVRVRLSDEPGTFRQAAIARLTPAGIFSLPSQALGTSGGGSIAVSPEDPQGRRSLERVFPVELTIDRSFDRLGGRALVRFDHGLEPLAVRGYRRLRQLLLRHLDA